MKVTSPVFQNNQPIPPKYTCDGDDVNPPLGISHAPAGTKSFALIMDDPDAPSGTWDHWLVWNIDPSVKFIAEDSVPQNAVVGKNTSHKNTYGSPCPPSGTHRYFFKLYALDTILDIPEGSAKNDLEKAMEGHILEQAELIGLYSRE